MRNDYFVFGGARSVDFGAILTGVRIEGTPERDVTIHSVPGRSGDLVTDNKRWKNTKVTYSVAILSGFAENFDGLKNAMFAQAGYQRLENTIRPDEYRLAMLHSPLNPETLRYNRTGRFDLVFDCKPQRFWKSGENSVIFASPGTLLNPTAFAALPLITVYGSGSGTVTVGNATVEIKSISDVIILDSDLQDAYRQVGDGAPENKNGSIKATVFPQLTAGENPISWTGGIEKIEIIPRWWTI